MFKFGLAYIVCLLFSTIIFSSAKADGRQSQIDLSIGKSGESSSSGDSSSISIDSSIVVHEYWDFIIGGFYSIYKEDGSDDYKTLEGSIGTKWYSNEKVYSIWGGGFAGREGSEVTYRGAQFGFSSKINKLWGGSETAKISFEVQGNHYAHKANRAGQNTAIGTSFNQRVYNVRLNQFIGEYFLLYGSYSGYKYDEDLDELSTYFSNRSNLFTGSEELVNGLNSYSSTMGVNWFVTNDFDLELQIGNSKKVIDSQKYRNIKLTPSFYIGDFSTSIAASRSIDEDDEESDFYEVSFGFSFP